MNLDLRSIKNKKIFITGGTGFIGGRVVEKLFENNVTNVRVLVSSFTNASRIARYPVSMIQGDIANPDEVKSAMAGSDIIIHCAYGNKGDNEYKRKVDVEGTRNILEAARTNNIERLIHLSTVMVYGNPKNGVLTEDHAMRYSNQSYPDNKIDAEKLVFKYHSDFGLPVCVLQPTAVYGPFAPTWTINILKRLQKKRLMLINSGEGYCNAVYIDDVVQAILRAMVSQQAIGQAFLISSSSPVTWKEFYAHYESMLGYKSTIEVSEEEALKLSLQLSKTEGKISKAFSYIYAIPPVQRRVTPPVKNRLSKTLLRYMPGYESYLKKHKLNVNDDPRIKGDTRGIQPYTKERIRYFKSKMTVRIDKAEKYLGYKPEYSIEQGMEKTRIWAKWANLTDWKYQ